MTEDERITAGVLACLEATARAVRSQDVDGMIRCLDSAVALYEERPAAAQQVDSLLRDLLVLIRSTRSLCRTIGVPEAALAELEQRTEALRQPFH